MADLTPLEKRSLERLFGMGGGYVLNFSNRTFQEFVLDTVGKDIDDAKYNCASGSKANRLRGFWTSEQNLIVGRLLSALIEYGQADTAFAPDLLSQCRGIVNRLLQELPVREIEALTSVTNEKEFEHLERSVRDAVERSNPESGLDHLHTYLVKFVRVRCERRGIDITKEKPLHSLFGEYIKHLREEGLIESEMTERILKSSISHMEAFNHVRNNKSLAHDNKVLGYEEALFIMNAVTSSIRFVRSVDPDNAKPKTVLSTVSDDDDLPF